MTECISRHPGLEQFSIILSNSCKIPFHKNATKVYDVMANIQFFKL